MNFLYRENTNGPFELFNTEYNDIYFSNVGAHKEALEKFVLPAEPQNYAGKKIKILDVCYGMGFNSKTFVDYTIKNNLNMNFEIDCVELDKYILALGLFVLDKNIGNDIHYFFNHELLSQIDLNKNARKILKENWMKNILEQNKEIFSCFFEENSSILLKNYQNNMFLHNIYYQNHETLKKLNHFLKINFKLTKLESILPKLECKYDLVFHDAFSILKQPQLWSEDIMQGYYSILEPNGKLLTYSNSRILRRTLEKIGFEVIINTIGDRSQNGTIAVKH